MSRNPQKPLLFKAVTVFTSLESHFWENRIIVECKISTAVSVSVCW